ncbi:MAG: glycosyl hydrolase family 18 protein, partial [Mucilaginibacter sp.]
MKSLNKIYTALLFCLLIVGCKSINAQNVPAASKFRVIGYLPAFGMRNDGNVNFDFGRINYLNIAFINPDSSGNFNVSQALGKIVEAAHAKHTKVLISIGGGSAPVYYSKLLSDTLRNTLIAKLVKLAADYNLDGI